MALGARNGVLTLGGDDYNLQDVNDSDEEWFHGASHALVSPQRDDYIHEEAIRTP